VLVHYGRAASEVAHASVTNVGGGAPPARSPAMRFANNYETSSRGSHPEERHLGARLASSVAKTARPQGGALCIPLARLPRPLLRT
jgi:hypothetical protein